MKIYFVIYQTGKGKFLQQTEEIVNDYNEAQNILQSLYEIDKAKGMNPKWLPGGYKFRSTFMMPNGKETMCNAFIVRYDK